MKVIRALGIIYFTAVCAAQTSQDGLPVPSLQLQSTWLEVFPSEEVKFKCDVNGSSDWNFIWLRNKEQIKDADPNLSLSVEQSVLTITAANPTQSGSYTCKGEHKTKGTTTVESDPLQLKVSYPPTPNLKLLTEWLDVFEDETVAFGCELGNSDWIVTWYKNQEKLQEDPSITVDDEGTQLNITSASKAHNGEYACKAELESRVVSSRFSNTKKVTVYDIPKPTLRRTPSFDPMFVGETVNFTCSVDMASGWEYHLQKGEKDPSVTGKVNTFLLTLSDKGRYTCSATRGETLTEDSEEEQLNVLEIPVPSLKKITPWLDVFPDESVQLSCGMDSGSGWTYMWSKAGRTVSPDGVVSFDQSGSILSIKSATATHAGQYTCKGELKGRSVSGNSDTGLTLTVYPEKPSVTLTQVPDYKVMFSGESVTFSCEISVQSPGWEYQWYKDAEPLSASGDKYSVNSINTANTGSYSCRAKRGTQQVFSTDQSLVKQIQVQDNKPKPLMTQQPNVNKVYIGESVSFKCKVEGSTGWRYFWYKNGRQIPTTGDTLNFSATLSDTSTYKCSATRNNTVFSTEYSDEWKLSVSEIPVPSLKKITPWLDVFPDESVQLSCGMDSGSGWTYMWSKAGRTVSPDGFVSFDQSGSILSIKSATATHAGQYTCKGELKGRSVSGNSDTGLTLTVYPEKPSVTLTQVPDYKVMFSGESVTFSCEISVQSPGWEYQWYKDAEPLSASGDKFSVNSINTANTGSYSCRAKRGTQQVFSTDQSLVKQIQVQDNKPKPLMTQQPNVNKVYIGESVSFKCKVEGSTGWRYFWYKNGELQTERDSQDFTDTPSHTSTYKCSATREKTNYSTEYSDEWKLSVSEIPVPFTKLKTSWPDVFPTEKVSLSCGMDSSMEVSSDWTYTWYRDKQKNPSNCATSVEPDGNATLSIESASASHQGHYTCSATFKSRPGVQSGTSSGLALAVYDKKPEVTLTQNPAYSDMHTGDEVSFSCHVNVSSGWEYLWFKDGSDLKKSEKNFAIKAVKTSKNESYRCQVKRGKDFKSDKSEAKSLHIMERPQAKIILLTGWSEVFSAVSLELKCGVDGNNYMWNYTWLKEGQPIKGSTSEKHTVTPQNDPEQSQYTCKGIREGRPSYSRESEPYKTKNLLLKRRVLLSISGLIFFGIIAVLLGCIALRFFRKPVDDDDGPEEADLFLSMAQQKGAGVPCPLVEYITDTTLTSPSKAGEENGTICSETTPLPISTQEDQAGTTEGSATVETNGGLVSFKQ